MEDVTRLAFGKEDPNGMFLKGPGGFQRAQNLVHNPYFSMKTLEDDLVRSMVKSLKHRVHIEDPDFYITSKGQLRWLDPGLWQVRSGEKNPPLLLFVGRIKSSVKTLSELFFEDPFMKRDFEKRIFKRISKSLDGLGYQDQEVLYLREQLLEGS